MKIISWWQVGIDTFALEAAKAIGVETWWYAPHQFRTESGKKPEYAELYWMIEIPWWWLLQRTKRNIDESDCTIIIKPNKKHSSPWTNFTIDYCKRNNKPHVILYADKNIDILAWLDKVLGLETYNFAWPRESSINNKARCKDIIEMAINYLLTHNKN